MNKKNGIKLITKTVNVFTDGSAYGNARHNPFARGGIGVFFSKNDKRNVSIPFYLRPVTNNRCELFACIRAIEQFVQGQQNSPSGHLNIISDSKYVINSMTKWIYKWHRNGWKTTDGKDVKNKDLIVWLWDLMHTYKKIKLTFQFVPAHRKRGEINDYLWKGNMMADKLSKIGTSLGVK